jgi:hypothetical protein
MSKIALTPNASGTGTFTISSPATNTNRTLTLPDEAGTIITTAGVPSSAMPAGSVLQVVQVKKTDTFSTASQAWVDVTGLSVSITPTSATNKILVSFNVNWSGTEHSDLKLVRDSTDIAIGDTAGSRTRSTSHMYRGWSNGIYDTPTTSMMWLDSPATTSSTTYKIQVASPASASYYVYINSTANDAEATYNGRNVSTITLMEISA